MTLSRFMHPAKPCLCLLGLLLLSTDNARADCSSLTRELDSIVVEHLVELRGTQYCTHHYRSQKIEIVLYFVEGPCFGNDAPAGTCGKRTLSFIAGYASGKRLEPLQIGASGEFVPKKITLDNETLTISGAAYATTDAECCPTIEAERRVRVTPSGFILTTP